MGITLGNLRILRQMGILPDRGRVLDIGSSNLYGADRPSIDEFAQDFGYKLDADRADTLADGSAYGAGVTKNASWVGELLESVGMTYLAFDIADGYATQILNLNEETIPPKLRGYFDTVLNFGTTEHVVNQLNAFRVIHDAVKVGGHIVHQLPTVGYIDHGYFCYTPRFFFDLAGHNEYELIDFRYDGPGAGSDMFGIVRDYASYFPALTKHAEAKGPNLQDFAISIVLRKTKDMPLRLPMETSTSVTLARAATDAPRRIFSGLRRRIWK